MAFIQDFKIFNNNSKKIDVLVSINKDNALISKKLVTLKDDVPTVEKIEDFIVKDLDKGKII